MIQLYDYQQKGVGDIRNEYIRGNRAPIYVLPTGGGKTVVFAYIAATAANSAKPKRVLILVHRIELLRQTANKLRSFGVRTGLISPLYTPDYSAPVQVAMVQTMCKRHANYGAFDLIIVDEAHHAVASQYVHVTTAFPESFQLGVTATPVRGDGRGLGQIAGGPFDSMVLGPNISTLIERGFLVPSIIYAPKEKMDLSRIGHQMGDFNKKDLNGLYDKPSVTGNAVEHYRSYSHKQPGVAFCVSISHAEHVAAEFRAAGYKSWSVDGSTDDKIRERLINGLADGSVDVLTSCDVISEGMDIPAITAAILLRPTESEGLFLQQVGRALRTNKETGKKSAIILDHAGNVLRHGLPDQDRKWSLDGEVKKRRKKGEEAAPAAHQCLKCFAVYDLKFKSCPECGFVREINAKELAQNDGELVMMSEAQKEHVRRMQRQEVGKAKTLSELEDIARQRGYKPGWAKHVLNSREAKNAPV